MKKRLCRWLALFAVLLLLPIGFAAADSDETGYTIVMDRNAKIIVNPRSLDGDTMTINGISYTPSYTYKGYLQIKYSELVLATALNNTEDTLEKYDIDLDDLYIKNGMALFKDSESVDSKTIEPNAEDIRQAATQLYYAVSYFYDNTNYRSFYTGLGMDDASHPMHSVYESLKTWPAELRQMARGTEDVTMDQLRSAAGEVYAGFNSLHEWLLNEKPEEKTRQTKIDTFLAFWRECPSFTNLDMYKAWADGNISNANAVRQHKADIQNKSVQMRRAIYRDKFSLKGKHFVLSDETGAQVKFVITHVYIPSTPTPYPVIIPAP